MAEGVKFSFVVILGSPKICKKGKIAEILVSKRVLFDYPLADIEYLQCLLGADNSLNNFPANVRYIGGIKEFLR